MWTKNFQIYKLLYKPGLEKADKPEIKSSTFMGHRESKEIPENIYFCFIDYTKAFDCVCAQSLNCVQLLRPHRL